MFKTKLKTTITRLSLAIPALLAVSQASAHPGGHMEFTISQLVSHVVASPFHAGIIAVSVLVVVLLINKIAKYKTMQRTTPKENNK